MSLCNHDHDVTGTKRTGQEEARSHCLVFIMRNDVERSPLSFFSFTSADPLRDCIFPSTRNHKCACQIFEGDDDGIPRVNVFLVYASRKRRDGEQNPSGRFRTGSFSRRHAIGPFPFSCSSSGHPTDCPTTWSRGERFGGHCESQSDAFQCKYLSPWDTA